MPNNKYQNYIYLFSQEMYIANRLLFRTGKKTWDVRYNSTKLNSSFLSQAGLKGAQVVYGLTGDLEQYGVQTDEKYKNIPNENIVIRNPWTLAGEIIPTVFDDTGIDEQFLINNDPGNSSNMVGVFELTPSDGTNSGSVGYRFGYKKDFQTNYDHYRFQYYGSLLKEQKKGYKSMLAVLMDEKYSSEDINPPGFMPSLATSGKPQGNFTLRPGMPSWDTNVAHSNKKLELLNPDVPFVYKQALTYVYEDNDGANNAYTDNQWKKEVKDFVKGYDIFQRMVKMGGKKPEMNYSTTKIGVPYDFKTVLTEEINEKQLGVATKQPKYDKIYNYYDSQYEPAVMSIIESKVIKENLLPSIYDFLYLEHQPNLKPFIKLPQMSLEDTNLGAINQYLDNLAVLYEKYTKEEVKNINATSYNWIYNSIKSELEPLFSQESDSIGSTTLFKHTALKVKFALNHQKRLFLSLDAMASKHLDEVVNIKNKHIPKWIDQSKTGIYFSEKSLNVFEETYDKDHIFPYLIKLNMPYENVGPIAKIFKENDLLDTLNTYVASLTVGGQTKSIPYEDCFGGAQNGAAASNFNLYNRLGLTNVRILFSKPPLTINEIFEAGNQFVPLMMSSDNDTELPDWTEDSPEFNDDDPPGDEAEGVETGTEGGTYLSNESWWTQLNSWRERNLYKFIENKLGGAVNAALNKARIFLKVYPKKGEGNIAKTGSRWFIWAFDKNGFYIDDNFGHELGGLASEQANIELDGEPFQLSETVSSMIKDLTGTPYDYFSFSSFVTELMDEKNFKDNVLVRSADIHIDNLGLHNTVPPQVLVYKDAKENTLGGTSPLQGLIGKLKELKLKKKLNKLFLNAGLLRTPDDIHKGKMCHEETLMYEIAKYKINSLGEEEYLQSIFLPIADKNQLSYYDTQVIPFTNYFYKIFAHKAVLGTKYGAKLSKLSNDADILKVDHPGNKATKHRIFFNMPYELEPYIEITRVPYYNTEAVNISVDKLNYSRVEDAPPLPPQIDFVPFKGIDNEILILMNNSIGTLEQHPKIIFTEDRGLLDDVALSQDKLPGEKLVFKSDDSQGTFELLRLKKLPENLFLSDISKEPTLDIYHIKSFGKIKNDSILMDIRPNKDYYFIARFIDIHGKPSNPTDVYKIRMIHQEGTAPYLTLKLINVGENIKKQYDEKFSATRNMQKYVLVQPNFILSSLKAPQTILDENGLGKGSALDSKAVQALGDVAGKKFKIRITSKQTGRKMDVNLTVKQPQTIINE